jgi:hypothetical protein
MSSRGLRTDFIVLTSQDYGDVVAARQESDGAPLEEIDRKFTSMAEAVAYFGRLGFTPEGSSASGAIIMHPGGMGLPSPESVQPELPAGKTRSIEVAAGPIMLKVHGNQLKSEHGYCLYPYVAIYIDGEEVVAGRSTTLFTRCNLNVHFIGPFSSIYDAEDWFESAVNSMISGLGEELFCADAAARFLEETAQSPSYDALSACPFFSSITRVFPYLAQESSNDN